MIRLLLANLRGLVRESRTLLLLTVAGVSLGVGSVVAVRTLNQGALAAFGGSVRAVSGQADLSIFGSAATLPPDLLTRVLADPEVRDAWPLCRVDVAVAGARDGDAAAGAQAPLVQIVGFDVFAPLRYPLAAAPAAPDAADGGGTDWNDLLAAAMGAPGWLAVTPELAEVRGWSVGDTVRVSSGMRRADLVIGALADFRRFEPLAPRDLGVMDIAQVQALLAAPDAIHQIDVVLVPGADPVAAALRLGEALGSAVRVQTPEQRAQEASALLDAFRLNLTALSLISVFVGVFLVSASVQASLVRRRREFGLLRAVGLGRDGVLVLILAEAAVLGLLGVAVGIPTGFWAAQRNLQTVSATLTSIYVLQGISDLALTADAVRLGIAVGLAGALGGALLPAADMRRRSVVDLLAPLSLHEEARRRTGRLAGLGLGGLLAGGLLFAVRPAGDRYGGFVLGALLLLCLPLLVPLVIDRATRGVRPGAAGWSLSLRNLAARLRTTSVAVAALAVAVSMMTGVTLLIGSFRQTLVTWLDVTIRADVYVSTESWMRSGNEAYLDRGFPADLQSVPGVQAVETQRRVRVRTADGRRIVWLNGVSFSAAGGVDLASRLPLCAGDPAAAAAALQSGGATVIGEPLARKAGLGPGDALELAGPRGTVRLPIAGVAYDYTSEAGTAVVSMETFAANFQADRPNNAALFLEPGVDPQAVIADLQERYRGSPLIFRSNADLRRQVLAVFDQTFAVTRTLQTMALLVAACGLALTMLIQARERAGELALLRALGATPRQVFRIFLGEGLGMAAFGVVLGLAGGLGLAALLILVINRDWFGWTIRPAWPGPQLLVQILLVLGTALAAGLYPALKSGLTAPAQLSRDDL